MMFDIDGHAVHASTGGLDLDGDDPVIVLVHGAGMDSTVWQLQTRYIAYRGYRPLAVDLPGHGMSEGPALESVPEMGAWLNRFIDAVGWGPAAVVGHSMGTFIAMEAAKNRPEQVASMVLFGSATAMPVHPDLLDKAANDVEGAAALMAAWSHAKPAHIGLNPTPGMWMIGGQRALVERSSPGALSTDLQACAAYEGAPEAAAAISVPTTLVIGSGDKMTPPRAARGLADMIEGVNVVELADTGHDVMFENPRATRKAILAAVAQPA